jgi:hypothetical protein
MAFPNIPENYFHTPKTMCFEFFMQGQNNIFITLVHGKLCRDAP